MFTQPVTQRYVAKINGVSLQACAASRTWLCCTYPRNVSGVAILTARKDGRAK